MATPTAYRGSQARGEIGAAAWEPPYTMGVAQEMTKRQKKKKKKVIIN